MEFYTNSSNTSTVMTYSGGVPGPTNLAAGVTNPIDCFHLFLSSDIYTMMNFLLRPICMLINRELQRIMTLVNGPQYWRKNSWHSLGSTLQMGIVSLHTQDDYCSSDPILAHTWFWYRNVTKSILKDFTISPHCRQFNNSSSDCSKFCPIVEGAATTWCPLKTMHWTLCSSLGAINWWEHDYYEMSTIVYPV